MNRWTVILTAMMFLMLIACGCAGGSGENPVAPASGPELTDTNLSGQSQSAHTSLLGYYDVFFDVEGRTMEIIGDRTAAYTINIVPFLNQMTTPPSGISLGNIVVDSSDPANLKVDVEFQWHHPFPTIDQYMVYDFMGVIITNGDDTLTYNWGNDVVRYSTYSTNTFMTNADGYTRWFNPTEFTTELIFGWAPGGIQTGKYNATVNPYKAYGEGLAPDGDLWDWLAGGSNNDSKFNSGDGRIMSLEFPMPPAGDGLAFGYAAVCCWEEQGSTGPYTPYHRYEAIASSVSVTDDLYYDGAVSGGNLILDIDLWYWSDKFTAHIVWVDSTVLDTSLELPEGTPGGQNISTYSLDIVADPFAGTTGHEFWVIAVSSGMDYFNGMDIPAPDDELAAFFRYPLLIADGPYNQAPIIDSGVTGADEVGPSSVETYSVTAHDPESDPITYSWTVSDNSTGTPVTGYDGVPGDGAGNLEVDFADTGGTIGDTYDIDCDVMDPYGSTAATTLTATVTNNPPIIDSGVDGDDTPHVLVTETYSVTAHDDDADPLTYSWTVTDDVGDPLTGYNGVPGNGDGTLDINWYALGIVVDDVNRIYCDVTDGTAVVPATMLETTATNILWEDDMESGEGDWIYQHFGSGSNPGWGIVAGGNDGHWWHSMSGNTYLYQPDCSKLWTPELTIPSTATTCEVEIYHAQIGYFWSNTISQGGICTFTQNDGASYVKLNPPVVAGNDYDNWSYPYSSTYFWGLVNGGGGSVPGGGWGWAIFCHNSSPITGTSTMDYSAVTGDTLRFGFIYASYYYNSNYYWGIDDIKVTCE